MRCAACGTENASGRFCTECGAPLAASCPSCGSSVASGAKFCGECGAALGAPRQEHSGQPAVAERRLVSVLFADLVGFTTASEERDAEETRELLSRYFDTAKGVIDRYGGTVEKFIGDAVMAVWGTPVTREDDAERAVRAALELVDAVTAIGESEEAPELRLRAGVLTGEAAVTIGAEGQGMVAGDLVNTASRIQADAEPGTVLVGEATRRATEAAVVYEDAGEHELKGRTERVHLSRALRVVANRGGEGRSAGLEAPFVGRERELRLVKELFHASASEGKAHLVLVTGIAGFGKSRVAWEFEKYIDGLAADIWWHRGRCLAYGEGVAYWALAEMVRGRARIVENEPAESALAKLHATIEEHVTDQEEREWVEPRLAHLLGLEEAAPDQRDTLFAAWRLFFERLAATGPVALVFEDLHWADAGLLDFVEYLLEWSRHLPIFVLALSRPELLERRPGFGTAGHGFTALTLEPLTPDAMETLLDGLVPGLPESVRDAVLVRAEGVPLYAVETVRMLLDRGDLELAGGVYRVTGEVETLAVPESLHALVASRLDGLSADERHLVQDASVLGKTFSRAALAAVSGHREEELEGALQALARKEVLFREDDPRSPERGQYGFLQDLVRHVAYETLARRDRKTRHLAFTAWLEQSWGNREQEIVEVVAAHYIRALELEPDAADAPEIRRRAREVLARAAERAGSLGASGEAAAAFARAGELADDPIEQAHLLARAGNAARAAGDTEAATAHLNKSIALFESAGETHAAARASANLAQLEFTAGRLDQAVERMERAFSVLERDEPDEDLAFLASQLARFHYFLGNFELAETRNERALATAESLRLPDVLVHGLNTAALLLHSRERAEQARALLRHALELALENDLAFAALRTYANLGVVEDGLGNLAEVEELAEHAVALARRVGDRSFEWFHLGSVAESYLHAGRWDEAVAIGEEIPANVGSEALALFPALAAVARHRGDPSMAWQAYERLAALQSSASIQDRVSVSESRFQALLAEGRSEEALEAAEALLAQSDLKDRYSRELVTIAVLEASAQLGRLERAEELVSRIESRKPGEGSPITRAHATRVRALLAAAAGDEKRAEASFKTAAATFREYGRPFWLAVVQLEYAEWLAASGRGGEAAPLLAEARETFERLRAVPWLERASAVHVEAGVGV